MASTAITPSAAVKNAALDTIVDSIDVGSADATGDIVLKTAGGATVATLAFSNPAFASASGGSVVANAITSATAGSSGTVTNYEARNRDNTVVFTGSVGLTGEALNLESVVIDAGDTITISAFTISI